MQLTMHSACLQLLKCFRCATWRAPSEAPSPQRQYNIFMNTLGQIQQGTLVIKSCCGSACRRPRSALRAGCWLIIKQEGWQGALLQ